MLLDLVSFHRITLWYVLVSIATRHDPSANTEMTPTNESAPPISATTTQTLVSVLLITGCYDNLFLVASSIQRGR